jgi:hypothetical protein
MDSLMEVHARTIRVLLSPLGFGCVQAGQHVTTSSRKFFAVIIERNGQELARDILHIDGAADARRKLMQLVRRHEIDPFEEPINCRVEELSE